MDAQCISYGRIGSISGLPILYWNCNFSSLIVENGLVDIVDIRMRLWYAYVCVYAYACVCMHVYVYMYVCVCMHAYIRVMVSNKK